jgi:hypothetical protein
MRLEPISKSFDADECERLAKRAAARAIGRDKQQRGIGRPSNASHIDSLVHEYKVFYDAGWVSLKWLISEALL